MIDMDALTKVYIDKLSRTGSQDAALLKVLWVAFNKGREVGKDEGRGEVYSAWVQHKESKEND